MRKGALISSKRLKQIKVLRVREADEKKEKNSDDFIFGCLNLPSAGSLDPACHT
jgi:hypothetical protein